MGLITKDQVQILLVPLTGCMSCRKPVNSPRLVPRAYCLRPQISPEESDRVGDLRLPFFKAASSLPPPLQWPLVGALGLKDQKRPRMVWSVVWLVALWGN